MNDQNSPRQVSFPRTLPVDDSWDVIVIGGGPSGCTAAASAAREGARTLLIEQTGCLGGMGTSALVPAWTPFSDHEKIIYKGMAERVFRESGKGVPHVRKEELNWVAINAEHLKRVYDDLVSEYGVTVRFNTFFSGASASEGKVDHIFISNKGGLQALSAKVYIDCTGDADLCAWAGAEFMKGDEEGKGLMPATHCFILTNVDEYAYKHSGIHLHAASSESPIYQILKNEKYSLIPDFHICNTLLGPRTIGFNAGHLFDLDNTKPEDISNGMMLGRKMAEQFRDALAEYFPQAFGNAYLIQTGALMGIRETRRIVGDYVLTVDDYLQRKSFADEICRNSYFIDVHVKLKEQAKAASDHDAFEKTTYRYGPGETHGIPYRCLTPRDLTNVLVAGRSVSTEQTVQGSVRIMPCCLTMGEAAGMAAAHTIQSKVMDVHKVDISHLQKRLREEGAYIKPEEAIPEEMSTR